jgi:PPE-repeat protein
MVDFPLLPPEINSTRMYSGAGSGPLFMVAAAWDGLAAGLQGSASSFDSVITGLASGPWVGPASVAMAAAATRYAGWLNAAAGQAALAAGQARVAATAFEMAFAATVHPAAVTANRMLLGTLIATNFLGQNTPAIAATEFHYVEMWAQDVAAMVGYHAGGRSVAATLPLFSAPPTGLAGMTSSTGLPAVAAQLQSVASKVPVSSVMSAAMILMSPASSLISPMMSLAQSANGGTAGLAGAGSTPELAGDVKSAGGAPCLG